jgi:hypothetical protein
MVELSPILAQLEQLYDRIDQDYYTPVTLEVVRHYTAAPQGLTIDKPIIALSSKGKKRTQTGWYNPATWVDSQEDTLAQLAGAKADERALLTRAEIVLATELLKDPVETASELLRQYVVHLSYSLGYKHLVGGQGYYPVLWQESRMNRATDHTGYVLPEQPSRGWGGWRPVHPAAWKQWVEANMDVTVFEVARNSDAPKEAAGSRMKKWRCKCTTIRCATRVLATCEKCSQPFVWAEPSPNLRWGVDTYRHAYSPADPNQGG